MLCEIHRHPVLEDPGIAAVAWLPVLFLQKLQAVSHRVTMHFLTGSAVCQRMAKHHTRAVDQMAAGVIDATVVIEVMEEAAGRIERVFREEIDIALQALVQEGCSAEGCCRCCWCRC